MKGSMYDTLLELPLFQGLTTENLTSIIEKVKMGFHRFSPKQDIARQNMKCDSLIFILGGKVKVTSTDEKFNFTIEEFVEGPYIIEPHSLFGMYTNYHATYSAVDDVEVLSINKKYILSYLCKFEIFNLNYLNIISNRAQTVYHKLWNSHIGNTSEKILNFLLYRCATSYGQKILYITMEDMATLVDDTRINISRALNNFQEKNLLVLGRRKVIINDLKELNDYIIQTNITSNKQQNIN